MYSDFQLGREFLINERDDSVQILTVVGETIVTGKIECLEEGKSQVWTLDA